MSKKFAVTYSVCGTMVIEAKNEEEAREKSKALFSFTNFKKGNIIYKREYYIIQKYPK